MKTFWLIFRFFLVMVGFIAYMILIAGIGSGALPTWNMDLALDSTGNIYVGNMNYIQVFSPEGEKCIKLKHHQTKGTALQLKTM